MKAFALLFGAVTAACGQLQTTPGELRQHATINSIGIEWDITGDSNHNARCAVQYRRQGVPSWKPALPLFRVDFSGWYADTKADRAYNMLAGSVLFLEPDTAYEVKLTLTDPDGGDTTRTLLLKTRPVPKLPAGGRTLHARPGETLPAAQPGDIVLLHKGHYGNLVFQKSGAPGRYIIWKNAGDGPVTLESAEVGGSHVWIEGLTFQRAANSNGLRAQGGQRDVVISSNTFTGFHYSVTLKPDCRDWYIADNIIVGDNDPVTGGISGEGIELNHSSGHVVAHNRISRTADGVSHPHRNCDIFGNDIFDVSDDGLEPDYGYANNRMWGNRITNCKNHGLSFQPMYCGPWYFIRNQVLGGRAVFKFRVQDRFLFVNNTFVAWGAMDGRMHHLLTALSRNNLFITVNGKDPVWAARPGRDPKYYIADNFRPTWMTDVDYDGFDWGDAPIGFKWNGALYNDVAAFAKAAGIEQHGRRVRKEEIFASFDVPAQPGWVRPQIWTLKPGGNAIDAGALLPNICENFNGAAPDLGAHESGQPQHRYGPRQP